MINDSHCRMCGSTELELAWDLAASPYGDLFQESKDAAKELPLIGLTLVMCRQCTLLQITQEVDARQIYEDYIYQSSLTGGLSLYYTRLAGRVAHEIGLRSGDLVVDVGSNDGTGLVPFKNAGFRVLGIEPSKATAAIAVEAGIPTITGFLNDVTVNAALSEHGKADLVCANFVSANVPDPISFFRSMRRLMADDGALSVVTGYHPDQFAVNMFDYINHDHLSYFSVASAVRLAEACDLALVSAERVEHKGGSVHLLFRAAQQNAIPDESVGKLMQRENWLGVSKIGTYKGLADRVEETSARMRGLLNGNGELDVLGVGASISTTHLLHQSALGPKISHLYDDDPKKQGRFSPGFGIEVSPLEELGRRKRAMVILLAWQHTDSICRRLQTVGYRGEVVIPFPSLDVVTI